MLTDRSPWEYYENIIEWHFWFSQTIKNYSLRWQINFNLDNNQKFRPEENMTYSFAFGQAWKCSSSMHTNQCKTEKQEEQSHKILACKYWKYTHFSQAISTQENRSASWYWAVN